MRHSRSRTITKLRSKRRRQRSKSMSWTQLRIRKNEPRSKQSNVSSNKNACSTPTTVQHIKPETKTKEVPTAEAVPTRETETETVDKAALTSLDQVTTKDLILHLVKSATTAKRKNHFQSDCHKRKRDNAPMVKVKEIGGQDDGQQQAFSQESIFYSKN